MAERQIASVVWREYGRHITVIYVEGEPDELIGSAAVAATLAAEAGLTLVETPRATVRWVRDPVNWHVPPGAPTRRHLGD